MAVLKNVTKEETVQYVLALLLQMLQGACKVCSVWNQLINNLFWPCCAENPARARLFHQQSEQHLSSQPDPYTVLLRYVCGVPPFFILVLIIPLLQAAAAS
jgi:V-type H+-transporting ATPase subunit H